MTRSVLDDLGQEITGIVAPVSICMALVVVLVKALNPEGIADTSSVAIATIAYHEKVSSCVEAPAAKRSRVGRLLTGVQAAVAAADECLRHASCTVHHHASRA